MAGITAIVATPILLFCSLPLTFFAVLTTTITFWVLLLRVSVVYLDLILALLHAYLLPSYPFSKVTSPASSPPKSPSSDRSSSQSHHSVSQHRHRQKSRSSSIGSDRAGRHGPLESGSFASLVGTGSNRDFEGVGGWRVSGTDDEEALWMGMNSRLELPAIPKARHHARSLTGGSGSGHVSPPDLVRTPIGSKASALAGSGKRRSLSGTASPEGYFTMPYRGSMTALTTAGDRGSKTVSVVSFDDKDRRKSSENSSSTSLSSTLTINKKDEAK
ncbi:hypothetical protein K431DRAFT_283379 [Polychaeton citri CBS 116435]|uniref:Uncharacterized protein n=1 Tax=Polychaeton citri CBS 116435 TaxID=1314669 RepID=A0A9P4QDL0_9PEZI|nr:hypothetical protein K431DRAFT_283379 [Polychaeton citri CBS 116435]